MSPTQEEKIDAIYEMIKKSEKRAKMQVIYKVLFWITMFAYSYYFMAYTLPWLMKSFMPNIPGISQNTSTENSTTGILKNPEVKKLLDAYLQQ